MRRTLILLLLCALVSAPAIAKTPSAQVNVLNAFTLEELSQVEVTTAAKLGEPLWTTPAAIYVIGQNLLQRRHLEWARPRAVGPPPAGPLRPTPLAALTVLAPSAEAGATSRAARRASRCPRLVAAIAVVCVWQQVSPVVAQSGHLAKLDEYRVKAAHLYRSPQFVTGPPATIATATDMTVMRDAPQPVR